MHDSVPPSRQTFFDSIAGDWDARVATESFLQRLRAEVDALDISPAETLLDLGCGTGNLTAELLRRLSAHGRVLAVDFSQAMLDLASAKVGADPRVTWLHADVSAMPVPAAGADRVICFSAWPHFPEPANVARELARVLRPGGMLHVLHGDGREVINGIHGAAGGVIAHDLLPPAQELAGLLQQSGFRTEHLRDDDDGYLVTARLAGPGS